MEYKVTITAEDESKILLGHESSNKSTVKKVSIKFDTIDDNVYSKGAGMLARMTIEGDINEDETHTNQLMALFNWAKSEKSDEQYRTVEVEIYNNDNRLRAYQFKRMFVVDYEEIYYSSKGGRGNSQDSTKFVLNLTQRENYFEEAKTF